MKPGNSTDCLATLSAIPDSLKAGRLKKSCFPVIFYKLAPLKIFLTQNPKIMKRIFSVVIAMFALQFAGFAQCPNASITTPGFYPPADQLAPIERGMPYNETVQINVPASFDTTVPPFGTVTVTIDSVNVSSITGAPANITYSCSPSSCTFNGGSAGCITFSGTTNDPAGQYPLSVSITAYVTVPLLGQQTQSTTLDALGITYYLTVIEAGALSATATATPPSICTGGSSMITASVTNGSGSETFSWSDGSTGNPITVNPTGSTTYTVTVTDGGNTATASASVTVEPDPTAVVTPTSQMICNGASATITASGGATYSWSTGETTASITVSPTATTFYTVTVTSAAGCTDTAVDTVEVNPTPAPVAGFDDSTSENTVTFTNTSTGATSYAWNFGDGSSGTDANPTHVYGSNGTFTVTLTATNSCGSDTYSDDVTIVGVGIGSVESSLVFSVYPNPNEGVFTVAFSDNSGKPYSIRVYDLGGKKVFEETLTGSGSVQKQVDLTSLPKGFYTLHLNSEKSSGVQKLTIR